jgi:hypothetical protein
VAKGKHQKMTPEERARQLENQRRLERIIERRLAEEEAARIGGRDPREHSQQS